MLFNMEIYSDLARSVRFSSYRQLQVSINPLILNVLGELSPTPCNAQLGLTPRKLEEGLGKQGSTVDSGLSTSPGQSLRGERQVTFGRGPRIWLVSFLMYTILSRPHRCISPVLLML